MKPGAILVNTSRGPIVDEAAMLEALHAGKIVAALDVYDREPLPVDHPLRKAPNTVLSPHLGYCVKETWDGFYPQMIENALAFHGWEAGAGDQSGGAEGIECRPVRSSVAGWSQGTRDLSIKRSLNLSWSLELA